MPQHNDESMFLRIEAERLDETTDLVLRNLSITAEKGTSLGKSVAEASVLVVPLALIEMHY